MKQDSVLIIDDDVRLRKTLSDILLVKGYHPTIVSCGKDAIRKLSDETIKVALIDLNLEDMTGVELLEKSKKIQPLTECILITGHASQSSAIEHS